MEESAQIVEMLESSAIGEWVAGTAAAAMGDAEVKGS
jgi:hypothetical protein